MNSAPHLPGEDRRDFERVLDDALRSGAHRQGATADSGGALTDEQLRRMALSATALIVAAAAIEYQDYVQLRNERRAPVRAPRPLRAAGAGPQRTTRSARDTGRRPAGPDEADREGGEPVGPAGAGLGAVAAVLAPVLAGAAAVIFLLVGYVLKVVGPSRAFARTLLTTGWVFGAITAAAILVAAVGLLLTALRNGATSLRADDRAGLDAELARARRAWHRALLERGIEPFLQEALAKPVTDRTRLARTEPTGRMPHLGYQKPGFSSPESGPGPGPGPSTSPPPRRRYSSPDFTSPEFGGPEHQPE